MELTSWPAIAAINQKNYYTEYLKRDDQILAYRLQQEENRNRMTKQAKDRDRALAQGRPMGPDGDVEMDEEQDEAQDEASKGTKTIVIHIGSQNLRIGLASDALPKTVPMVIAKKSHKSESEGADGEPKPKRVKLDDGSNPEPEKQFGEEVSADQAIKCVHLTEGQFASKFSAMSSELKIRMRMNKRRVLPQSRDMVLSYNRRNPPETISEHNDPLRIDWTETPTNPKQAPEYITGKKALRIPDNSTPRYKLYWPIRYGWVNELDYPSKNFLWHDIGLIIRDAIDEHLGLNLKPRREWAQYGCVFVIPDLYDRKYVTGLLDMGLTEFGFGRVCFFQESLAASFGAGFSTACIVDIGAQKTSICCVEEGMCIENSRVNLKMGGQDVTETFVKMLLYNHFPYADINLKRRYDFLLAEELKQKHCTMNEVDITVQLFDFHLRAAGQDTRKYTFKAYDEVILAPLGLFKPAIFDDEHKLEGRRKLIDRSYDIYEAAANDPTSTAQAEILTQIAPHLAAPIKTDTTPTANGTANGNGTTTETNGYSDNKARPQSFTRIKDTDATPRSTPTGSPTRDLESTPQPFGTPAAENPPSDAPEAEEEEEAPLSIERRDDILPVHPLPHSILTSITHASRSSSSQKIRDFLSGIMLVGGGSLVPGLPSYLEESLQAIRPGYAKDILIGRPPRELDAQVVVWKGGSVFGRMGKTNDSWVGGLEYERLGERVLGYKCMWAW